MRRNHFAAIAVVLLILSAFSPCGAAEPAVYPVGEVIDGDTLKVVIEDRLESVRLLNIDTPERGQPGYNRAGEALRRFVGDGPVRLEWDRYQPWSRGTYGRVLALVYVDQACANVEIVRQGWSPYWTKYGRSLIEAEFKEAETEARDAEHGLWADGEANVALVSSSGRVAATCYGSSNCRACSTCNYCGYCAERGGTCGVCSTASRSTPTRDDAYNREEGGRLSVFGWVLIIGSLGTVGAIGYWFGRSEKQDSAKP